MWQCYLRSAIYSYCVSARMPHTRLINNSDRAAGLTHRRYDLAINISWFPVRGINRRRIFIGFTSRVITRLGITE